MGKALAPYLPRMLPTLNVYSSDDHKIGPEGAYQLAELSMSNLVTQVLETCEVLGPPNTYKAIKYAVPTYQSVCLGL